MSYYIQTMGIDGACGVYLRIQRPHGCLQCLSRAPPLRSGPSLCRRRCTSRVPQRAPSRPRSTGFPAPSQRLVPVSAGACRATGWVLGLLDKASVGGARAPRVFIGVKRATVVWVRDSAKSTHSTMQNSYHECTLNKGPLPCVNDVPQMPRGPTRLPVQRRSESMRRRKSHGWKRQHRPRCARCP